MDTKYDMYSLAVMAVVISFLGFNLENIWLLITKGYADNRNMRLPFLLGYGVIVTGMYLFLGLPADFADRVAAIFPGLSKVRRSAYFIMVFIIVSVGEIVLGTFMEKTCHIEYWNYEWIPMHITKYTSVPTSIGFAIIITLFMEYCFDPIMTIICQIPFLKRKYWSTLLISLLTADCLHSYREMRQSKGFYKLWQFNMERKEQNEHHLMLMKK